ncbi:hypothetical protein MANES_07G077122v8 [Manihot esculenta]|uniref:Uncharacterized protein n=2 Tax=Manihot esculenta TaxID=3983 RepID=A0ACB7HGB0_MANES|nr:hypothetical protein MANES_07G077122v8 [Manihot esculenta]KAG8650843.1 hypothetical protein MANES_07G077122v8 [Manihot esculenta]
MDSITHSRLLFSLPSSALPKSLNQSLNLINSSFLFNINPLFSSPSLYRICFSLSRPTCRRPSALPIGCHLASRTVLTTPYCHLVSIFYCSNLPIGFLCCVAESLRFWLFEPRCDMHDIGGWYIETFGRDKKGRTVLSQRYWDGLMKVNNMTRDSIQQCIYLLLHIEH